MDKNRMEGATRNLAGKLEEAGGRLADDPEMQAQGAADQVAGQAQNAYGQTLDSVRAMTTQQPFLALTAALGVGVILGLLLSRR